MPTAPVDAYGNFFYYEDSGPIRGTETYTTVVLFHGLIYHSAVFKRMLPLAEPFKLRLVVVNWRDYPGSSPYTVSELESFKGDHQNQAAIMEEQGRHISKFLEYLIQSQDIPPLTIVDGMKTGGLTVLTWSLGNTFVFPFLAYAHRLEASTKSLIERCLRTVIIFDPPVIVLGKPLPEACYVPFKDASIEPQALGDVFLAWVSTYYTPISDATTVSETDISAENRKGDPKHPATILQMSPEERVAITDVPVLLRSASAYMGHTKPELFWEHFQGALFDTKGVWPNVNAVLLWCDMGPGDCVWGAKVMADELKDQTSKNEPGKFRRSAEMYKVENANHLMHWDEPGKMMRLLVERA